MSEADVVTRYGVTPRQWCDFRALAGDPSDGIPGLPGVGMAKAAALLAEGRSLDDLHELGRSGDPAARPVAERWDDVRRWRELIRLRTDLDLGFDPKGVPTGRLPSPSAICAELGLLG